MTKANEFFDGLGETISRTAKDLSERAEVIYETQKIRSKISSEERIVEKAKADIGNLIYQKYLKDEKFEEEIENLCEEITQHMKQVSHLKDKVASLKGEKICPVCGKSMEKDMLFCPHCGTECAVSEPEKSADCDTVPEEGKEEESSEEIVEEDLQAAENPEEEGK